MGAAVQVDLVAYGMVDEVLRMAMVVAVQMSDECGECGEWSQ